ncbi:MAG TPA: V-type ATP synthase subunit F [Actinophytocola sp.]|jgi:vacuolar-type H+-ATPase subunit F/Vma7|uniref:V-type ATP synthase subunit F n=1 Tax=Actinophytocola sp. TaxID=1872138 RepID=UPI002F921C05
MGSETRREAKRIAVIGEPERVYGYSLAGAIVRECPDAEAVRSAWDTLGDDVAVVVLTPTAAKALTDSTRPSGTRGRLTVVLPQ